MRRLLLLAGLISADKRYILDTSTETSDLVGPIGKSWHIPPESEWEDASTNDGDGIHYRALQICEIRNPSDSYVYSPLIRTEGAQKVFVEIKYSLRDCKICSESIDILVQNAAETGLLANTRNWRKVASLEDGYQTKTIELSTNGDFYLAYKDHGACGVIFYTKIYYNFCKRVENDLAVFENQPAPERRDLTVSGSCVAHAISADGNEPTMTCLSDGEWISQRSRCVCQAGYEPNRGNYACIPCGEDQYKPKQGNEKCLVCPANSASFGLGATQCTCLDGFYRGEHDHETAPCYGIPSEPLALEYTIIDDVVDIRWSSPTTDGGRSDLMFRLECQQCEEGWRSCRPCGNTVQMPSEELRPNAVQNFVKIRQLTANTSYRVKVHALNGVSDVAQQAPNFGEVRFRTQSSQFLNSDSSDFSYYNKIVGSVIVTEKDETSARLSWSRPTGAVDQVFEIRHRANSARWNMDTVRNADYKLIGLLPNTEYTVQVRAIVDGEYGPWSTEEIFRTTRSNEAVQLTVTEEEEPVSWLIVIVFAGLGVVTAMAAIVIFIVRRNSRRWSKESRGSFWGGQTSGPAGTMDATVDLIPCKINAPEFSYVDSRTETATYSSYNSSGSDPSRVVVEADIGHDGEFTYSYGKLNGRDVAIKASPVNVESLRREAEALGQFDHPNVLRYESINDKYSPYYLITEFCQKGALTDFIRTARPDSKISTRMLLDVAEGLSYLHHQKSYIHGAIQASNIMVAADGTSKVSGFGDNSPDAMRYAAPECIANNRVSNISFHSDVWAFGILMWEVFSHGERPYAAFEDADIVPELARGQRLPRPAGCPEPIFNLMVACWSQSPSNRPHFHEIVQELDRVLCEMTNVPTGVAV